MAACGPAPVTMGGDAGAGLDASVLVDAGAALDAGALDASVMDAGGPVDAGAGVDAGVDAGTPDAGRPDAGPADAGFRQPPPLPTYGGICPALNAGPTQAAGRNMGFVSSGDGRSFVLLVPPNYTPTKRYPVIWGYHWLNASANSVIQDAELERAVAEYQFIAVVPENLVNGTTKAYLFDWPFVEVMSAPKELRFFEDVLACLNQQFSIDPARIHVFGASAGGLWTTYLSTTDTVDRVASVLSISGGLGEVSLGITWKIDWVPKPNKFPAMVVWGGPLDFLGVDFNQSSLRYRTALRADNHVVVSCMHNEGHKIPPFPDMPDGGTRYSAFWDFFRDHPYGLPPNTTPYAAGLPASFPGYCTLVP